MESVSRPPHRRKHSASTNASLKNPYDDVLFSNGGKAKFGAHEYAEIFSGSSSSSIPVLDLSGLDERVGSGDPRSSKLDYSNIFGGLGDGDVAVPYEELFNGAKQKSKTRIPTDAQSSVQESGSVHTSGKSKRPSIDASDQTTGETKQHFSMSFNKTSQRNIDASNGETHIAELHAVPGFAYFVNGTPRKKEGEKHLPSLKREVSRTWSFSAGVDEITLKGGLSRENSPIPDKSCNLNEVKLKSHISNVPPYSSPPNDPNEKKDERRSRLPNFASKEASDMTAGEYSPPLFDEELDENSVAALSAAALKKAVEQAQESIRIAKMIMERKREGPQDGLISRSKGRLKKDTKKIRTDHEADGSKQNNSRKTSERVRENFGAAEEHGDSFVELGKKFDPSGSPSEKLNITEKVELGNVKENVEANEACRDATDFTGLVANAECESATLMSEKEDNFIFSTNKLGSHFEELKIGQETLEQKDLTIHQPKGPENIAERVEKIVNCSPITQEQDNIIHEAGENLRVSKKDVVTEERAEVADDKGECEKKFVEHEEMVYGEHLTELKSDINNLLNKSGSLAEKNMLIQEDMEKKSENHLHGKSSDEEEKANLWFDSELQLKEPIVVRISETEPEVFPEVGKVVNDVCEQKIDLKKSGCGHDGDEKISGGEYEQNETAERSVDTFEFEAAENNIHMEANNCAEVQESEVSQDAKETEENNDKFEFQEIASEKDIDEAVGALSNDSSTAFSETQEQYDADLNNEAEECQASVNGYEDKDSLCKVTKAFSDEVNEMSDTDSLRRCASEENFIGSTLNNAFEVENVGLMEKPLPKDEDTPKTAGEAHNAAKVNMQNLPEVHASNFEAEEHDRTNIMEGASENKEGYVSTSILENMDEVSSQDSQECAEKAKDDSSSLDTTSVESESVSEQNERVYSENQSEEAYSQSNCEPKEADEFIETGKQVETDQKVEQKDSKGNERKSEIDDQQQRIEAIKRGREREKDRIAVERAIREARERAFAEARERAERAAVEKAAAEARQRAMAEAREKPIDKASNEAKLRAERAAVERATAEARERALEKARSQKTSTETRTQAERYSSERFSGSSRSSGLKHSLSSSDLEKLDGSTSESAQRRKARLERHQRIMERAAKALAEKNMRDILAQKEQAERNRLAESLDAEIKRWATGKESNLRALLSTLQYILGADSGWQAIPLTEIITTAAVKKAYRKATLCVHPDKLQQRGASIQQKYICEKVFDLLKAAWNRFNSEER